jgi:hypothetical protein
VSPRVISSAQTFSIKFILPFVFVAFTFPLSLAGRRDMLGFLALGVLIGSSLYWYYSRLKKVAVDSDGLVISNYVREVRVPWRNIVDVSGSRWVNTRQIKVTFDRDIGFGTSIIFKPKVRLLWPGQESPIAQELRDLILMNRDQQSGAFP